MTVRQHRLFGSRELLGWQDSGTLRRELAALYRALDRSLLDPLPGYQLRRARRRASQIKRELVRRLKEHKP